jgi:alginate O-acetyltransferase complex protein AlgI
MEITSLKFAILAILSVIIFYFLNPKLRVGYLALLSALFIASYSLILLIYVVTYSLFNYFFGIIIQDSKHKIGLFRTGVFINIVQLVVLKYASFAIDPIISLFNGSFAVSNLSELIVPIGISYFTLQSIGYLINVKMGWEKAEKNYLIFLLYISFFPKFLSGPIERSNHFLPQLKGQLGFNPQNITAGLRIALRGFFKKIIIANHLAATISEVYANTDSTGGGYVFLIILIQPLYLYFDFSGYTDIAIGIARTFGIELLPNFNRPFLSENMTNFWKRFHISLSSWFNDYVFKQTSFRLRKLKNNATTIAVFLTWILFGIWHGAGWNFMVLGIIQALAIYYEYRTKSIRAAIFSKMPGQLRVWSGRVFTYLFYGMSLTFFFSPDLSSTLQLLSNIFMTSSFPESNFITEPLILGLLFAISFLIFEVVQNDFQNYLGRVRQYWFEYRIFRLSVYYCAAILILFQLNGNSSFIYEIF